MLVTWIIFFLEGVLTNIFLKEIAPNLISFLIIGITSFSLIMELTKYKIPKEIFIIIYFSYLFRLILMFFDLYGRDIFILPNSGVDSEMYHNAAMNGLSTGDYLRGGLYSRTLGIVYYLFGENRIVGQFFNVLLSVNSIILTIKLMDLFEIKYKAKKTSLLIFAFLPNYAILSSILLRESMIIYLVTLSIYFFSIWWLKGKRLSFYASMLFSLIASSYHSGAVALLVSFGIILSVYNQNKKKFELSNKSIFTLAAFILIFILLYNSYSETLFAKISAIDSISDVTNVTVLGGSGYSVGISSGNELINLLINTPIRMFYYILSPLPWTWRGLPDIVAFLLSGVFYGYCLFISCKTVIDKKKSSNRNIMIILLIIAFSSVFMFSWGVSNAGTALRHRDKFISVFILLLSFVKNEKLENKTS